MALCSIAIAAGVVGVVAAVRGLMFRRRFRAYGPWAFAACGPTLGAGCHGAGYGDGDRHDSRRRRDRGWGGGFGFAAGPGGSFWLRALFARLDTTPGQEREIRAAIEELQSTARDAKAGIMAGREELATAVGGESFDESALGEASGRADAAAARVKDAFAVTLKRIHAVLDARQRERLAELLAKGPGFRRRGWGNPYRDAAV